jgi:hypothetical protein
MASPLVSPEERKRKRASSLGRTEDSTIRLFLLLLIATKPSAEAR